MINFKILLSCLFLLVGCGKQVISDDRISPREGSKTEKTTPTISPNEHNETHKPTPTQTPEPEVTIKKPSVPSIPKFPDLDFEVRLEGKVKCSFYEKGKKLGVLSFSSLNIFISKEAESRHARWKFHKADKVTCHGKLFKTYGVSDVCMLSNGKHEFQVEGGHQHSHGWSVNPYEEKSFEFCFTLYKVGNKWPGYVLSYSADNTTYIEIKSY